jgi:serine/threonine protein kinase
MRDECIDVDTAMALHRGAVEEVERERIEVHLERCDSCMDRFMALDAAMPASQATRTQLEAGLGGAEGRQLEAGDEVDHFRVVRRLGRGGMGEVYLAEDVELGREVALKMIAEDMEGSAEALERFRTEARATARLRHPHIVTIHAIGRHRGAPYVALEFVEGDALRDRLRGGPLTLREGLRVMTEIADAVAAAHERGIWHRDLKPSNILLDGGGRVRVLDFGLAKIAGAAASAAPASASDAPEATTTAGTPLYMAPEQWRGTSGGAKGDIWALGIILVEIVTGEHPFVTRAERDAAAVASLRASERVVAGELAPGIDLEELMPPRLAKLARACLATDPEARPTAAELLQALRQPAEPAAAQPRSRRFPWLLVAVAVVPATGVAVAVQRSGQSEMGTRAATPPARDAISADVTRVPAAIPPASAPPSASAVAEASAAPTPVGQAPRPRKGMANCTFETLNCGTHGRCTATGPRTCIATSNADCRRSQQCRWTGRCGVVGGNCAAVSAADCRASSHCSFEGGCSLVNHECVPSTDAECAASYVCQNQQRCVARGGTCVAPD